jgi:hypothetical protein
MKLLKLLDPKLYFAAAVEEIPLLFNVAYFGL